jgi:hypothetical protein
MKTNAVFPRLLKSVWMLAALLPFTTGLACGKQGGRTQVIPVRGRVLWQGKPLANALVVLHPQNTAQLASLRPVAHADDSGSFELTTYEEGDGAPVGDYAVTIEWRRPAREQDKDPPANQLPARYSRPDSTPLHVTIDKNTSELPALEVKR